MAVEDRSTAPSRPPMVDVPFDTATAERPLPDTFASVVARHGDRLAVVDATTEMSFAALDQRSGAVAAPADTGRAP